MKTALTRDDMPIVKGFHSSTTLEFDYSIDNSDFVNGSLVDLAVFFPARSKAYILFQCMQVVAA